MTDGGSPWIHLERKEFWKRCGRKGIRCGNRYRHIKPKNSKQLMNTEKYKAEKTTFLNSAKLITVLEKIKT
jgi:hypothetical protein